MSGKSEANAAATFTVANYFGGCPKCGRLDDRYDVGGGQEAYGRIVVNRSPGNWFVCHAHKLRWSPGSVLSSNETEAEKRARWTEVEDYVEARPLLEGVYTLVDGLAVPFDDPLLPILPFTH